MSNKTPTTLLFDGDLLAYRTAAALEKAVKWDDDTWTLYASEKDTFFSADSYIERLQEEHGIEDVVIAISDTENFRKDFFPEYKANRIGVRRPMTLKPLLEYLKENYNHVILPRIEADDVIGILVTEERGKYLVDCADKDMRTIPNMWLTTDDRPITEREAFRFHMAQTLMGDTTDNYKGCPSIGEKRAFQFLDKVIDENPENYELALWEEVLKHFNKAYKDVGGGEEEALVMARVSKILTADLWDGTAPTLWQPPLR